MLLLQWKYASTYTPFRHIPKLFCSYTGSKETKILWFEKKREKFEKEKKERIILEEHLHI
jgi:hypothetical protein